MARRDERRVGKAVRSGAGQISAPDPADRNTDKVVGDLYLGTSPGFKKVHARRADSDDIYAITFANYEATARTDDWLDKALLKPTGDVTAVTRPDHWRVAARRARCGRSRDSRDG